jgi:hypothetical protein
MKAIKIIFCLSIVLFTSQIFAQRPVHTDDEVIAETVIKEVDALFQSPEFIKKKNKKFADVKGTITVDIGIVHSGKVATFFKVESDIKNIDFINFMSDYILEHKFKFKLQKQQRHKIRHTLIF